MFFVYRCSSSCTCTQVCDHFMNATTTTWNQHLYLVHNATWQTQSCVTDWNCIAHDSCGLCPLRHGCCCGLWCECWMYVFSGHVYSLVIHVCKQVSFRTSFTQLKVQVERMTFVMSIFEIWITCIRCVFQSFVISFWPRETRGSLQLLSLDSGWWTPLGVIQTMSVLFEAVLLYQPCVSRLYVENHYSWYFTYTLTPPPFYACQQLNFIHICVLNHTKKSGNYNYNKGQCMYFSKKCVM